MASKKIKLSVHLNTTQDYPVTLTPDHIIEGRLLGVCLESEALQILEDFDMARRIHTGVTKPLDLVVSLVNAECVKYLLPGEVERFRLITTIDVINNKPTNMRQLFISDCIELVSSESPGKAEFMCKNGETYLSVKEI